MSSVTMNLLTPPLTPATPATQPSLQIMSSRRTSATKSTQLPSPTDSDPNESFSLPPPVSSVPPPNSFGLVPQAEFDEYQRNKLRVESARYAWKPDMTQEEKIARRRWLSEGRGRSGLRIVIVTENFLPKVDGVTRTLAILLEHLEKEGHQCMLLGPGSGMDTYAGHPLVGTAGVPLVVYPGLKLNFLRPKFLSTIKNFQPDVVHFVDPIWLGAQTLMAMELGWAGDDWVGEGGPAIGTGINGAVVASYHTNLATYATLFGMPWLEPIIWRFQRWLYSKTMLTLCPSPSTKGMLHANNFDEVRLWPRGIDLSRFGPHQRSAALRASWGVGETRRARPVGFNTVNTINTAALGKQDGKWSALTQSVNMIGVHHQGRKASLPLTPPESPAVGPVSNSSPRSSMAMIDEVMMSEPRPADIDIEFQSLPKRLVLLFVGRISWEKNIHLLLAAYAHLPTFLPAGTLLPKLVFVGDGPARPDLENICAKEGYDATFMGEKIGEEVAVCFASADIFAFPSFTETFGQVVLEALASGLPVVGLNAQGTKDLVIPEKTGLLLQLPAGSPDWPSAMKSITSVSYVAAAKEYARLLATVITNNDLREKMGRIGSTEGIRGFTWWDAMEQCVDGYREALRTNLDFGRKVEVLESTLIPSSPSSPSSPKISRVNRVVSKQLAHRGTWDEGATGKEARLKRAKVDTSETIWHLKTLLKFVVAILICWAVYSRILIKTSGQVLSKSEV